MRRQILALILSVGLLTAVVPSARATSLQFHSKQVNVTLSEQNCTTYVPLRTMTYLLLPGASVSWEGGQAVVRTSKLTITARPGDCYLIANGRYLYIADGVKAANGITLVPVRVLAKAMGATVSWDAATDTVIVTSGSGAIASGDSYYDSASVYWLSRIISAESASEPLKGKIAVGNVVLNRVASADFPDCIYDVIFDSRWGGQFEPVSNGTIYDMPTEESVIAAKLCLDGASAVGNSIYFLNPEKSSNFWAMNNCEYVATIGNHKFYA